MNWQLLARANTHPLRISILEVLEMDGGRCLSPSELAYELRMPLSNVNYHVTELFRSGLLELVGERPVRGATEHFYCQAKVAGRRGGAGETRELAAAL
jgi:DNA-binding transcriptional ArsR family regulator